MKFDIYAIKEKLIGGISNKVYSLETFEKSITLIEKKLGFSYSEGTYKHYKTTLRRLKDFTQSVYGKKDVELNKVDYNYINSFDVFLKTTLNIGTNTIWGYHRHEKKVLNDSKAMGLIGSTPYDTFKVKRGVSNRDFLTLKEIQTIEHKQIDNVSTHLMYRKHLPFEKQFLKI